MNDEPTKSPRRWKLPLMIMGLLLLAISVYVYVAQPWYPLYRANRTPGRAWSAWDAADHNVDGKLTREEMELSGKQTGAQPARTCAAPKRGFGNPLHEKRMSRVLARYPVHA